jgi:predicted metal-binding membrane protein
MASRRDAFRFGVHHGIFCVGCCWAIMLLMSAVGTGNVSWMPLLGAVMAIDKNASWGGKLSQPLGFGLIASAAIPDDPAQYRRFVETAREAEARRGAACLGPSRDH